MPEVEIPDTPIAREAKSLIPEGWLLNHCFRTYAIGMFLGRRLSFDKEVLFVAWMLHDVGLTEGFEQRSDDSLASGYERQDAPCFAVQGIPQISAFKITCPYALLGRSPICCR